MKFELIIVDCVAHRWANHHAMLPSMIEIFVITAVGARPRLACCRQGDSRPLE